MPCYFGEDGLLRSHLCPVDVSGGAQGENYAFECRALDGIMLQVFAYKDARQKIDQPILVSLDLSQVQFT